MLLLKIPCDVLGKHLVFLIQSDDIMHYIGAEF